MSATYGHKLSCHWLLVVATIAVAFAAPSSGIDAASDNLSTARNHDACCTQPDSPSREHRPAKVEIDLERPTQTPQSSCPPDDGCGCECCTGAAPTTPLIPAAATCMDCDDVAHRLRCAADSRHESLWLGVDLQPPIL